MRKIWAPLSTIGIIILFFAALGISAQNGATAPRVKPHKARAAEADRAGRQPRDKSRRDPPESNSLLFFSARTGRSIRTRPM